MFAYYLKLGFASLRRNPVLTGLMVLILAVGVAASMSTLTVLYVMSGDPIPEKSGNLFVPLLDNGPMQNYQPGNEPPNQLTYRDAMALYEARRGLRQSAIYGLSPVVDPGRPDLPPFLTAGVAVHGDFFAMMDVPFLHGGPWSAADDARAARVAVISRQLAERVFGDADAVGKTLRIGEYDYAVAGVVGHWQPLPKFYRVVGSNSFGDYEDVFLPFATAIAQSMEASGAIQCHPGWRIEPGFAGIMNSECNWVQFWVEFEQPAQAGDYRDFLAGYVDEQKRLGRFERPLNNRLHDVMQWLESQEVVGNDNRLQTWLAFGFLLVCLVNTVGLLLAKFTARSGEIGVRRALGAPRREVFRQYLIESGVIGLVGGALGLVLTFGALWLIGRQSPELEAIARMDWLMLLATFVLATTASILAGLFPTWRACQIAPAIQLKSQ